MGALQPGIPNPTMIPEHWKLVIIDFKDCFFTIPMHPDDAPKFAFTFSASESHAFFHQNAAALSKDYGISMSQAHVVVNACPDCQHFSS
ncbi:POK7 protein, partial [Chaetorhynchus papuensis]|nr:POK7 protein [Chaetorhynchus papuensis]